MARRRRFRTTRRARGTWRPIPRPMPLPLPILPGTCDDVGHDTLSCDSCWDRANAVLIGRAA
jgi:hypothetical protein